MKFYTSFNQKRPVRLCEETRKFAYESLYDHKYGKDTSRTPCVDLSHEADLSYIEQYDLAVRKIAQESPLRICEGEKISCAATLGESIGHRLPAKINGEFLFTGISHLTIDFETTLSIGINGLRKKAVHSLQLFDGEKADFANSCISAIDSFELWINRYIEILKETGGYEENVKNLSTVPFKPATSFYEAVQCIWAVFAFCRLCGNWPGIGRLDLLLGEYLEKDLENGILTVDDAREILAHFFIKGCEWITGEPCDSGDAQHYQNIVLSGCDAEGNDITNTVTYLVLDIVEELGISDFPISVRVSSKTSEKLMRRISEVMRYGNGVIAVYNEDTVIEALQNNGYSLKEARGFANDGCWEVMLPGKSYFSYIPFDALALLQHNTLNRYLPGTFFNSFSELYKRYISDLSLLISQIHESSLNRLKSRGRLSYEWNDSVPCTVISLFEEDCIEKGLSYTDGGTKYTVCSPHLGGLADVANSLYAIKRLVWEDKVISFEDLMRVLSSNWADNEELRTYASSKIKYYGNDNDDVDMIAHDLLLDFAKICTDLEKKAHFKFPAGVSTFGRQIGWAKYRYALPYGLYANSVLANNMTPTPETAFKGATAIINSYCKSELSHISNGAALDIRLLPNDVKGEDGLSALSSLIRSFCILGGFFLQIDVADTAVLYDAQNNPVKYPALAVRIAGWNARFVTLGKEWQDMIIDNMKK